VGETKDKTWLVFSLIILAFILIEIKALPFYKPGDENVYLYMGKLVSEGVLPYRDFFYAHPPLQLIVIGILFKVFGFNMIILNLMPLAAIITGAFFLFRLVKEKFGSMEAIIAAILFLFTFDMLSLATDFVGTELAVMFFIIGFYFFSRENYAKSGIFFGLASVTRLYSLIPILVIFVIVFLRDRKHFLKLVIAFSLIFILTNSLLIILFGQNYLAPVYKYHFMKPKAAEPGFGVFYEVIKTNWFLFLSSIFFIFVKDKRKIGDLLLIALFYILFLFSLNKVFSHYFMLLFVFLAILGGYSLAYLAKRIKPVNVVYASAIILSLIFMWNAASDILFLENYSFSRFKAGEEMVKFIRAYTKDDAIIFGDDSIAPLLALTTGRRIAFNFVDTNDMRFKSGITGIKDATARLEQIDIVVVRLKQGIITIEEFRAELQKKCELIKAFKDSYEGDFLFYNCKTKEFNVKMSEMLSISEHAQEPSVLDIT